MTQFKIGILALQGAVEPHEAKLRELQIPSVRVRTVAQLEQIAGLILPGGESTTMVKLLKLKNMWEPLKNFVRERATWGICAGTILLSKHISGTEQDSLQAVDITVERNAFGRQIDSFISENLSLEEDGSEILSNQQEGVFIRAPRIKLIGEQVKILFSLKNEPVMVRQGHLLCSTFHPELSSGLQLHKFFHSLAQQRL